MNAVEKFKNATDKLLEARYELTDLFKKQIEICAQVFTELGQESSYSSRWCFQWTDLNVGLNTSGEAEAVLLDEFDIIGHIVLHPLIVQGKFYEYEKFFRDSTAESLGISIERSIEERLSRIQALEKEITALRKALPR